MSDISAAIWDAIERRARDSEDLARAREERIAASREARDWWEFADPASHIPGRIDNQRKKKP